MRAETRRGPPTPACWASMATACGQIAGIDGCQRPEPPPQPAWRLWTAASATCSTSSASAHAPRHRALWSIVMAATWLACSSRMMTCTWSRWAHLGGKDFSSFQWGMLSARGRSLPHLLEPPPCPQLPLWKSDHCRAALPHPHPLRPGRPHACHFPGECEHHT